MIEEIILLTYIFYYGLIFMAIINIALIIGLAVILSK